MTTIIKLLAVEYIAIGVGFAINGDYPRLLYFIAAAVLNVSILYMK